MELMGNAENKELSLENQIASKVDEVVGQNGTERERQKLTQLMNDSTQYYCQNSIPTIRKNNNGEYIIETEENGRTYTSFKIDTINGEKVEITKTQVDLNGKEKTLDIIIADGHNDDHQTIAQLAVRGTYDYIATPEEVLKGQIKPRRPVDLFLKMPEAISMMLYSRKIPGLEEMAYGYKQELNLGGREYTIMGNDYLYEESLTQISYNQYGTQYDEVHKSKGTIDKSNGVFGTTPNHYNSSSTTCLMNHISKGNIEKLQETLSALGITTTQPHHR